jgi:ubiquitin-conjugating enzyme E2 R
MTTQASARLTKELKDLTKNPVGGFKVEVADEANLFEWNVFIAGPPDTEYESGIFKASMSFPEDYPISPPKLKFVSDFWHPNVYPDGKVCISILHTPDPLNPEEKAEETWRPIQTVESILVSVCSMLADPNFSSPANVDASVELRKNPDAYKKKVRKLVEKSIKELPKGFEMPKPKKYVPEKPDVLDDLMADEDYLEDAADYASDEMIDDEDEGEEDEEGAENDD